MMQSDGQNGDLMVARGTLERELTGYGDSRGLPLPVTRQLGPADLSRVDAEEGLTNSIGTLESQKRSRSFYELLPVLIFAAISVAVCYRFLPWGRFFRRPVPAVPDVFVGVLSGDEVKAAAKLKQPSPVQRALLEIEGFRRERRFNELVDFCATTLNGLGGDRETNRKWIRVWAVYLDALYLLRQPQELTKQCQRLLTIDPDSEVAVYYRARSRLDRVATQLSRSGSPSAEVRRNTLESLAAIQRECETRLRVMAQARLSGGKDADELGEREWRFRLLLCDTLLKRWICMGRKLDDDSLEIFSDAVREVNQVPESDAQIRQELKLWKELLNVLQVWHSWEWFRKRVDGKAVDRKWVELRIARLEAKLTNGRNPQ